MAQGGLVLVQIHIESGLWRPFPRRWPDRGPVHVEIYIESGLRRAFPGRRPREVPYGYKSILKVASEGRFRAAAQKGPVRVQIYIESAFGERFRAVGLRRPRAHANLY